MPTKEKKTQFSHWDCKQILNYYFTLVIYADCLSKNKKKTKLFLLMSKLLDKSSAQCRTHHHKKLTQIQSRRTNTNLQMALLYKFYFSFYRIRKLDETHLSLQIQKFLQQKLELNKISKFEYQCLMDKMQSNLALLQFDSQSLSLDSQLLVQDQQQQKQLPKLSLEDKHEDHYFYCQSGSNFFLEHV